MFLTTLPDLTGFTPGPEEWKKAKLIEALIMINSCFGGIDIPLVCLEEIAKICSMPETDVTKVKDKSFRYARYIMMSQCIRYDEDKTKSDALIEHLGKSGKFRGFLG